MYLKIRTIERSTEVILCIVTWFNSAISYSKYWNHCSFQFSFLWVKLFLFAFDTSGVFYILNSINRSFTDKLLVYIVPSANRCLQSIFLFFSLKKLIFLSKENNSKRWIELWWLFSVSVYISRFSLSYLPLHNIR